MIPDAEARAPLERPVLLRGAVRQRPGRRLASVRGAWSASRSTTVGDVLAADLGEQVHLAGDAFRRTAREQDVGALGTTATPSSPSRSRWTVLISLRPTVNGTSPTRWRTARLVQSLDLRLRDEEGGLGRIALDRPLAVPPRGARRRSQGFPYEHGADLVEQDGILERATVDESLALGPVPLPVTSTSPEPVTTFPIVISFLVSVPVLSEQTTEAEPSVSTDEYRSRSPAVWLRAARRARARRTGRRATAWRSDRKDTPTSRTETTSEASSRSEVSTIAVTTTSAITITAMPRAPADPVDLALERRPLYLGPARAVGARCPSLSPSRSRSRLPALARE